MSEDNKYLDNEEMDIDNEDFLSEEDFEEIVTVVDEETGESFDFYVACNFDFEEELYYVLVSLDDSEPVALFAKRVSLENGELGFETVDEENFPRIAAEYNRLCDELEDEDFEDYEEDDTCHCACHHHNHKHSHEDEHHVHETDGE